MGYQNWWPWLVLTFTTWLTQGSPLVLLSNGYQYKKPHLQIRYNLSGLLLANCKWLPPIVIAFNTLCPVQFYIHWCVALHWTHWGLYFKKIICTCLGSYFSQKVTTVGSPPNFEYTYLSYVESLNHNILSHHQTHIEHIFENIIYIYKKRRQIW